MKKHFNTEWPHRPSVIVSLAKAWATFEQKLILCMNGTYGTDLTQGNRKEIYMEKYR